MRVRSQLTLLLGLVVLQLVLVTAYLAYAQIRTASSLKMSEEAAYVLSEVAKLQMLASSSTKDNVGRIQKQWPVVVARLRVTIARPVRGDNLAFSRLRVELSRADKAFWQLSEMISKGETSDALFSGARQNLLNHFNVLLSSMNSKADRLARQGVAQVQKTQQDILTILAGIMFCSLVFIAVWSGALWCGIIYPVRLLMKGIAAARSGDLDYRVEVPKGRGEFVELASAFNDMSRRLRGITVSRKMVVMAEELERERIGRELHDGLGQPFTALKLHLGNAVAEFGNQGLDSTEFEMLLELLKACQTEIRTIIQNLKPTKFEQIGFIPAIQGLCSEMGQNCAIEVCLDTQGLIEDPPEATKLHLYRMLQEALSNAAKHSQGSRVDVQILSASETVEMMIEDNGVGFELAEMEHFQGNGLPGLQERVDIFGGELVVESGSNRGTCVMITFPNENPT